MMMQGGGGFGPTGPTGAGGMAQAWSPSSRGPNWLWNYETGNRVLAPGGTPASAPTASMVPDVAAYQAALAQWRSAQAQAQRPGQGVQGMGYGELTRPFSLTDFQESPAYQFNLSQGLNALNKAAAARGGYYNPATLQDISKFTQGTASNEFLNAYNIYGQNQANKYNRLSAQSGAGQNAAVGLGGLGANMATALGGYGANAAARSGGYLADAGAAQAGGIMGLANAVSGGASSIYNNIRMNDIINSLKQQQASTYNPGFS